MKHRMYSETYAWCRKLSSLSAKFRCGNIVVDEELSETSQVSISSLNLLWYASERVQDRSYLISEVLLSSPFS